MLNDTQDENWLRAAISGVPLPSDYADEEWFAAALRAGDDRLSLNERSLEGPSPLPAS